MTIDRNRRTTFEEAADLYNETCPGYPDELVEDIIRLSALEAGGLVSAVGLSINFHVANADTARHPDRFLSCVGDYDRHTDWLQKNYG